MLRSALPTLVIFLPSLSETYKERLIAHFVPYQAFALNPGLLGSTNKAIMRPPKSESPCSTLLRFRILQLHPHISNPPCHVIYKLAEYS